MAAAQLVHVFVALSDLVNDISIVGCGFIILKLSVASEGTLSLVCNELTAEMPTCTQPPPTNSICPLFTMPANESRIDCAAWR